MEAIEGEIDGCVDLYLARLRAEDAQEAKRRELEVELINSGSSLTIEYHLYRRMRQREDCHEFLRRLIPDHGRHFFDTRSDSGSESGSTTDTARDAARDAARDTARDAARDAKRDAARDAERDAARNAERSTTHDATGDSGRASQDLEPASQGLEQLTSHGLEQPANQGLDQPANGDDVETASSGMAGRGNSVASSATIGGDDTGNDWTSTVTSI